MMGFINVPTFVLTLCAMWTGDATLTGMAYAALGFALLANVVEWFV